MSKSRATFLLTPPQREAVIELAEAYVGWLSAVGQPARYYEAKRLITAQDAFGIELINRETLLSWLDQEAA